MKMSKSHNILVLITLFLLSMVLAFCTLSTGSAKADTTLKATSYFVSSSNCEISLDETNLVASLKKDANFSFRNDIVIDDLALNFTVSDGVSKVAVSFETECYSAIGMLDADGKIILDSKGNIDRKITKSVEIDTASNTSVNLVVSEVSNSKNLKVEVNGVEVAIFDDVERVDKTTAKISIKLLEVKQDADETQKITLLSVDQKASDTSGAFKQEFAISEDKFVKVALPRITLGDNTKNNIFIKDSVSGNYDQLVMVQNAEKTFSMNAYSVLGSYNTKNVYIAQPEGQDDLWISNEDVPKKIAFRNVDDSTLSSFNVVVGEDKDLLETYSVKVIDRNTDKDAPIYLTSDVDTINLYNKAIEALVTNEVEVDGQKVTQSIALGTEITLPSLRDLVYDEYSPFINLDYELVYYNTGSDKQTLNNNSTFVITKSDNYMVLVVFKDEAGNEMDEDAFFKFDKDDLNMVIYGDYKDLIFNFNIQDNATINIETLDEVSGVGYIGVKYKAPAFKIEAEGCKTTYVLKYNPKSNATKEDEGWIIIPKVSSVTKEDYSDDYGNTYSSVKSINYDGELTFTPTKAGSYMIECTAVSEYTTRTDSAYSIVNITSSPKVVEVPNYWLRDNIWTVVFFSVGTLCLIGIIVLLCIKPKDETEVD